MPRSRRHSRSPARYAVAAGLLLAVGCVAVSSGAEAGPGTPGSDAPPLRIPALVLPPAPPDPDPAGEVDPFVRIHLSESGEAPRGGEPRATHPPPEPLGSARTAALLERLPPLRTADAPQPGAEPAPLPPETAPAHTPLRPPPDPPEAEEGGLRVVSISPSGRTDLAPHLTVVFSEPMVALGPDGIAEVSDPPAVLEPALPGRWIWADARTLRFDPAGGRLSAATPYTVRVPAGILAASGARLGAGVVHELATEGPRALGGRPHAETTGPRPLLLLVFDQEVRTGDVLRAARLVSEAGEHALREARAEELAAEPRYRAAAEAAGVGRWVALRPADALPPGTEVQLELSGDLASAEGPLPAGRRQVLEFSTHGPFVVESAGCTDPAVPCTAYGTWTVELSNPLPEGFPGDIDPREFLRVEPAGTPIALAARGSTLRISGAWEPFSTARIELLPALVDRFGQAIEGERRLEGHFGGASPALSIDGSHFVALDPTGPPILHVQARALETLEIELHRVEVSDWPAFVEAMRRDASTRPPPPFEAPGERVRVERPMDDAIRTGFARVPVDLSAALRDGRGQVVVVARGTAPDGTRQADQAAWVQVSSLALHAWWDHRALAARVWSLEDLRPLDGVEVALPLSGAVARTDGDGYATLPVGDGADSVVVARRGEEVAILPPGRFRGAWGEMAGAFRPPAPLWHAVTDRGLYRPGEEVRLHGWIRRPLDEGPVGIGMPDGIDAVRFEVQPPRGGGGIAEGTARVERGGWFHLDFPIPAQAPTGNASVTLRAMEGGEPNPAWTHRTSFRVAEFVRPEYEVRVEADPGPHVAGRAFEARLAARYFDGPPLPGAPVRWQVSPVPTAWVAPGWQGWRFGPALRPIPFPSRNASVGTLEASADEWGAHALRLEPGTADELTPVRLRIEAEVQDLDLRAGSGTAEVVLHPAEVYPALRTERAWGWTGEPFEVRVAVVDLEGALVESLVPRVTAERLVPGVRAGLDPWERAGPVAELPCAGVNGGSPGAPAGRHLLCRLEPGDAGTWRISAEVRDAAGRMSRSDATITVGGGRGRPFQVPASASRLVDMTLERTEYEPGDTARVLLAAEAPSAEGTLALVRGTIREVFPFRIEEGSATVAIPLEGRAPGTYRVQVQLAGGPALGSPNFAPRTFRIAADAHRLGVEVRPERETAGPGDEVEVEVVVRDHVGRPASGGEVTLWAVDESILGMAGYELADPVQAFHARFLPGAPGESSLQGFVLWGRRPPPAGLGARFLDARTGAPLRAARARLVEAEVELAVSAEGEVRIEGLPPGTYTLLVEWAGGEALRRTVQIGAEGVDLGVVLVERPPVATTGEVMAMLRAGALGDGAGITIAAARFDDIDPDFAEIGSPPGDAEGEDPVSLRTDFSPLAAFEPALALDDEGRARTVIRLPDTMTRYRIFAVATRGGADFGSGEGVITARRDLVARAGAPRFLLAGDRARIPVLVQNASDREFEVEVVARAAGALVLEGNEGVRVRVPAGERREVAFPAAAVRVGDGRLEVLALAEGAEGAVDAVDAVAGRVSVRAGGTPRVAAAYGELAGGGTLHLPVELPADAIPGFGELEVRVSTSALQRLGDALLVLCREPLPWPEPTISRVFAVAAVAGHLEALTLEALPEPGLLRAQLASDAAELGRMLGPWIRWGSVEAAVRQSGIPPFLVTHAMHALILAEEAGVEIPTAIWSGARWHLGLRLEAALEEPPHGDEAGALVLAHLLYMAAALEVEGWEAVARAWLQEIEPGDLPVEALSWLFVPFSESREAGDRARADDLLRILENRAIRSGGTATLRQGEVLRTAGAVEGGERLLVASHRRTDAVALAALLEARPDHPLTGELARGLLAHRDGSFAGTLPESAWGVMALGRYLSARAGDPSSLELRGWVAGRPLGAKRLGNRAGDARAGGWTIALSELLESEDGSGVSTRLVLAAEGSGTLHWRAGLRYAPAAGNESPVDRGFVVSRRYEAVDRPDDVVRDADGTWRIRAGARVRVRVTLAAPVRRYQVHLTDPLPAGLEPVNPALLGTGLSWDPEPQAPPPTRPAQRSVNPGAGLPWWIAGSTDWTELLYRERLRRGFPWHIHRELRDDRIEAYAPFVPAGSFESSYLVRAVLPGEYRAPPVRVEELDAPEVFGQGAGERLVVEGR